MSEAIICMPSSCFASALVLLNLKKIRSMSEKDGFTFGRLIAYLDSYDCTIDSHARSVSCGSLEIRFDANLQRTNAHQR